MKKKYLTSLLQVGFITAALSQTAFAQNYEPLTIASGFNADVIANGSGTAVSKTSTAVDDEATIGTGYAFLSRDFMPPTTVTALTYGLPTDGILGSAVTANLGMQFKLNGYDVNNSLRIAATNDSGTLVFTTPMQAKKLFIAATSGSSASTIKVKITFSDNTTEEITGISISDWYNGSNFIVQGVGRVNRANDGLDAGGGTNPRIYQLSVDIGTANQAKFVQSITITKTSTANSFVNIFGATADLSQVTCAAPTALTAGSLTSTGASISWTAATGAASYEYFVSTTAIMPAFSFSTATAAAATSVTLSSLTPNTTYYVWVRSVCGVNNKSGWTPATSFTTLCGAVATTAENFDSYGTGNIVPACWARIISGAGTQTISSTTPASGSRNIYQTSSSAANSTIVVLPIFSNINAGTHWLRFKLRATAIGDIEVGYVTDATNAASFVNLQSVSVTNTTYTTPDAERQFIIPTSVPSNAILAVN